MLWSCSVYVDSLCTMQNKPLFHSKNCCFAPFLLKLTALDQYSQLDNNITCLSPVSSYEEVIHTWSTPTTSGVCRLFWYETIDRNLRFDSLGMNYASIEGGPPLVRGSTINHVDNWRGEGVAIEKKRLRERIRISWIVFVTMFACINSCLFLKFSLLVVHILKILP